MQPMQAESEMDKLISALAKLTEEVHQLRLEFIPALRNTETMQKQQLSEEKIRSSIRKVRSRVNG
jgi:hypothetical protein